MLEAQSLFSYDEIIKGTENIQNTDKRVFSQIRLNLKFFGRFTERV
jgi:hypothetical protein